MRLLSSAFFLFVSPCCSFLLLLAACPSLSFDAALGYRTGHFSWSIGSFAGEPNILSELEWNDLQMVDLYYEGECAGNAWLYARLFGNVAWIVRGKCVDSDYAENDRRGMFSLCHAQASHSSIYEANLVLETSLPLSFRGYDLVIRPFLGYGYREEQLRMHTGEQVLIEQDLLPLGPIIGLNSRFHTHWWGPLLGWEWTFSCHGWVFHAEGSYHAVRYWGKGHWNLRYDYPDGFDQHAHGYGQTYTISVDYGFASGWKVGMRGFWERWRAKKGKEVCKVLQPYLEKGILCGDYVFYEQPFNGATWESLAVLFHVGKSW